MVTEGNHASEAVLMKLGFRLEGTRAERDRVGKKWVDLHEYGLLKSYYLPDLIKEARMAERN